MSDPPATRRRNRTMVSTVTAVLIAMLATLFGPLSSAQAVDYPCPGGNFSGAFSEASGSGQCPSLHNRDIVAQRTLPGVVYRGDSRPPIAPNGQGLFDAGLWSRGTNSDIVSHVQGDRTLTSEYISTSGTQSVAESFARSQGVNNLAEMALGARRCSTARQAIYALLPGIGNYLLQSCYHGTVMARTYVYRIDPHWASQAMYIPDQIRNRSDLYDHYHSQDEWAFVRHIPNYAIIGVEIYTMTARYGPTGLLEPASITAPHFEQFVGNPHHAQARVQYDPAQDPGAHWDFNTNLDSPTANAYTRGCSTITRCRSDG
ncbi:hypothetical protein [Streptomyces arenae]|uniref:hypothetical protein n=1 Tax=Streptomyces arenae TaxID=29301 RepID=UPI00265A1D10|nr:hypothetical protein [Streptomyces arenae]MCG7207360.1 hypothetical protein [Streptomyces arenae]